VAGPLSILQRTKGGAFGIAGCFSFYPVKLLGAYGDAGAVVTNSREVAERLNLFRNHGRTENSDVAEWSFNCRMDNLHAAILDLKPVRVPEWIERRREIANLYHKDLMGIRQLILPPPPEKGGSYFDVFQNYEIEAEDRDGLFAHLKKSGIETLISWGGKGVHQFRALGLNRFKLPRTEEMFKKVLMLPMHCELTDDQVRYTSGCIKSFYRK